MYISPQRFLLLCTSITRHLLKDKTDTLCLHAFTFFLYVRWSARSAALDRALRAQPLLQQVRRQSWQKCPSHCSSWCACGGRANVSLRLAVFVCCTLYILTHAACVGRERQRGSSKLLCINRPDLGELGPRRLAGFLLKHRIVQASHAAVLRRRTEWLKVTVQVRWPCPCQPFFVAPIGRAPSSPTSRFYLYVHM